MGNWSELVGISGYISWGNGIQIQGIQAVQGYPLIPSKGVMAGGLIGNRIGGWWSDVSNKV